MTTGAPLPGEPPEGEVVLLQHQNLAGTNSEKGNMPIAEEEKRTEGRHLWWTNRLSGMYPGIQDTDHALEERDCVHLITRL